MKQTGLLAAFMFFCNGCFFVDPNCFRHIGEAPEDFPDYAAALEDIRQQAIETDCAEFLFADAGTCDSGDILFVSRGDGYTSRTDYFDAAGTFIALRETTDLVSFPCFGEHYWPRRIPCDDRTVIETICGFGG